MPSIPIKRTVNIINGNATGPMHALCATVGNLEQPEIFRDLPPRNDNRNRIRFSVFGKSSPSPATQSYTTRLPYLNLRIPLTFIAFQNRCSPRHNAVPIPGTGFGLKLKSSDRTRLS